MNVFATAEQTGGAVGFFENTERPGEGAPLHSHPPDEAFYVLSGSYEFFMDGEWYDAPTGSFVFVPGGVPHGFRAGPSGGRKIGMFIPGGNEALFTEWQALAQASADPTDALKALSARLGIRNFGAVPKRSS